MDTSYVYREDFPHVNVSFVNTVVLLFAPLMYLFDNSTTTYQTIILNLFITCHVHQLESH